MFNFINDILLSSGLSMDILHGGFRLINISNKCVYIEGDLKLGNLSNTEMEIKIKKGKITIKGKGLKIKNMSSTTLLIIGAIEHLEDNGD